MGGRLYGQACPAASAAHLAAEAASGAAAPATGAGHVCCLPQADRAGGLGWGVDGGRCRGGGQNGSDRMLSTFSDCLAAL
jgi:hypothetical protein